MLPSLMHKIVSDKDLHARWLNTLSYLEYIGFRKIVKSQDERSMNAATLQHANEEGRHALLLKKLSLKEGGPRYDDYAEPNLLCGAEAREYFQSIDEQTHALVKQTRLTYLCVTWLVEVRALDVYGAYIEALAKIGISSPLNSLLKEEERHLDDVREEIAKALTGREDLLKQIENIEDVAFKNYVHALNQALSDSPVYAH